MIANPYGHIKDGADRCIPLFCTACAFEAGFRAATAEPIATFTIPAESFFTPAEQRWQAHCEETGRPWIWPTPHGELP